MQSKWGASMSRSYNHKKPGYYGPKHTLKKITKMKHRAMERRRISKIIKCQDIYEYITFKDYNKCDDMWNWG